MSEHSSHGWPASTPFCAAFEPLLPLLSLDELEAHEVAQVWAHAEGCDFCQRRLREYGVVLGAVRTSMATLSADVAAASFTLRPEQIMRTSEHETPQAEGAERSEASKSARVATDYGSARRPTHRWTAWSTIAAALLVSFLVGALLVGHGALTRRNGAPRATATVSRAPKVSIFPLTGIAGPSGTPWPMYSAVGKDGSLWYVQRGTSNEAAWMGHVSPAGTLTKLPFPTTPIQPVGISIGGDGAVWIGDDQNGVLWRIDPHTGAMRRYDVPGNTAESSHGSGLFAIAAEPDGAVWYVTNDSTQVGRLDPTTGVTTWYPVQAFVPKATPQIVRLSAASNDVLWLLLYQGGYKFALGRYDVRTRTLRKIDVTQDVDINLSGLSHLAAAPDGSAWWTGYRVNGSAVTRLLFHVLADGTIHIYPVPQNGIYETPNPYPTNYAVDAQSDFWYLQADDGAALSVMRVTPQGVFQTVATLPYAETVVSGTSIASIAVGPNNTIWVIRSTREGPDEKQYAVRIEVAA